MDFTLSFMPVYAFKWGFLGIPINGDGGFGNFFRIPKNPHVSSPHCIATLFITTQLYLLELSFDTPHDALF